jgi:BolA protein
VPTVTEKYVLPPPNVRYLVPQAGERESESKNMTMQERIVARLTEALEPQRLDIVDESDRHAGHAGVRTGPGHAHHGGGTHYRVRIVSAKFTGLNRVARHRLVYDLLPTEFADGLHALALVAKAPGEP